MSEFLQQLFSPGFMPHGFCYLWDSRILWLHAISDGLIALSYYCIPILLVHFIRKRRDLPFNWIFWMFGGFILACGTTHVLEIWNIWHGSYLLSGIMKAITAAISMATTILLVPLIPRAIALPNLIQLSQENRKLEGQIAKRKRLDNAVADAWLRRRVTTGFIVAILLTVFIGLSSWRGARSADQYDYWVSHTHEVMEAIQRTSRHVIEAETSARAFALSGQEPLLVHYQTARGSIYRDEDGLRHLTADNLSQQRRLDVLGPQVSTALEFAEHIIAKRRKLQAYPGGSDALEIERLMDVVRATTRDMEAEETRLLIQRTERAQAALRLTKFIAIIGALLGVGLWGLARFAVNREIDVSARARAEINVLNAGLEQRVEQRTAALHSEIAERQQAEAALRANEEMLRLLLDGLKDHAVYMLDPEGRIASWNEGAARIKGYTAEEVLGKSTAMFYNAEQQAAAIPQKALQTALLDGRCEEQGQRVRKDGSTFWAHAVMFPLFDEAGHLRGFAKILHDITDQKRAEGELLESQQRFQTMANSIPQLAWIAESDGHIFWYNQRWYEYTGTTFEQMEGWAWQAVHDPEVLPKVMERWQVPHVSHPGHAADRLQRSGRAVVRDEHRPQRATGGSGADGAAGS